MPISLETAFLNTLLAESKSAKHHSSAMYLQQDPGLNSDGGGGFFPPAHVFDFGNLPFNYQVAIAVFSGLAASMVCAFLVAVVLQICGYSKLYRDSDLHWTERARRLLPLRSLLSLTVNLSIVLQPTECFFLLKHHSDWRLPIAMMTIWMFSQFIYASILTLSSIAFNRIRTWKERFYDLIVGQMLSGSIYYLGMLTFMAMSVTPSLTLNIFYAAVAFILAFSIHFGSVFILGKGTGAFFSADENFERKCIDLAVRLKVPTRPTIVIVKWTLINALCYPMANIVLLPTELFRFLSQEEILAIVAHEYGHLKESFRQKASRLWGSAFILSFFTLPILVNRMTYNYIDWNTLVIMFSGLLTVIGVILVLVRFTTEGWHIISKTSWPFILCAICNGILVWKFFAFSHFHSFENVPRFEGQEETRQNSQHLNSFLGLLTGMFCILTSLPNRNKLKLEEAADRVAVEGEEAPGLYAIALLKLYQANLIPAVTTGRTKTHPSLYDRLIAAGLTPDFPRPKLPKTQIVLLFALAIFFIHPAVFFLSGYAILLEIGTLSPSP